MNTIQPHRSVPTQIVVAIVLALAFSGAIHADDKNKKGSTATAQKPAPKASTPTSSAKPQKPATGNGGAAAGAGSTRGSGTQNGASGGTGNSGRRDSRTTGGYKAPGGTGTGSGNTRVGLTKGPNGKPEVYKSVSGSEARFGRDGKVHEIHRNGMTVVHGPANTRRIVAERADRSRVVVYGGGRGYVQRPFLYHGHEFAGRTYYYFGRPYSLYYRRYPYRGLYLAGYAPYRYYRPGFYGWVYNPWLSPVPYGWGWAGSPWYRSYGYYFSPYSVYPSASFWLTDYLIAASLQEGYQQQEGADSFVASTGAQTVLTPDIKQAIASEVQSQIALENAESQTATQGGDLDMNSSGLPRMLSEASPSHPRIFVVAALIGVTGADGQECALSEGDVLRLSTPPPPGSDHCLSAGLCEQEQGLLPRQYRICRLGGSSGDAESHAGEH